MTTDCSLNDKFNTWKFQAQNMGRTWCVHKLFWMSKQKKQFVFTCSQLGIFMYWTCNLMSNLLWYCGLVDAKKRASEFWQRFTCKNYIKHENLPCLGQITYQMTFDFCRNWRRTGRPHLWEFWHPEKIHSIQSWTPLYIL